MPRVTRKQFVAKKLSRRSKRRTASRIRSRMSSKRCTPRKRKMTRYTIKGGSSSRESQTGDELRETFEMKLQSGTSGTWHSVDCTFNHHTRVFTWHNLVTKSKDSLNNCKVINVPDNRTKLDFYFFSRKSSPNRFNVYDRQQFSEGVQPLQLRPLQLRTEDKEQNDRETKLQWMEAIRTAAKQTIEENTTPFQMYDVIPTLWCCMSESQRDIHFADMKQYTLTKQVNEPFMILDTIEDIVVNKTVNSYVLTQPSNKGRMVVIYTDIGKDIDDTINAIVALTLLQTGHITTVVFVTCGGQEQWRVQELTALITKFKLTQLLNDKIFVIPGQPHTPALKEQSRYSILHESTAGEEETQLFGNCSLQQFDASLISADSQPSISDIVGSSLKGCSLYICICGVVSANSYQDIQRMVKQYNAHVCVQGSYKQSSFKGYNIASRSGTDCANDSNDSSEKTQAKFATDKGTCRQGTATLAEMVSDSKTTFFIAGGNGDPNKVNANKKIYDHINETMKDNLFKKQTAGFLINMHRSSAQGRHQAGVDFDKDKYTADFWDNRTNQSDAIVDNIGPDDFTKYIPKTIQ